VISPENRLKMRIYANSGRNWQPGAEHYHQVKAVIGVAEAGENGWQARADKSI
jgi:hypothetical protein